MVSTRNMVGDQRVSKNDQITLLMSLHKEMAEMRQKKIKKRYELLGKKTKK